MGIHSAVLKSPSKAEQITLETVTQVNYVCYGNNVCGNNNDYKSDSGDLGAVFINEPAKQNTRNSLTDTETYHRHECF